MTEDELTEVLRGVSHLNARGVAQKLLERGIIADPVLPAMIESLTRDLINERERVNALSQLRADNTRQQCLDEIQTIAAPNTQGQLSNDGVVAAVRILKRAWEASQKALAEEQGDRNADAAAFRAEIAVLQERVKEQRAGLNAQQRLIEGLVEERNQLRESLRASHKLLKLIEDHQETSREQRERQVEARDDWREHSEQLQVQLTVIGRTVLPNATRLSNEQIVKGVETLLERYTRLTVRDSEEVETARREYDKVSAERDCLRLELATAKEYCDKWQKELADVKAAEPKEAKPITLSELAAKMHSHEPAYGGVGVYERELEALIRMKVEPHFEAYEGWSLKEIIVRFVKGERDRRRLTGVATEMHQYMPTETVAYYERELREMVTRKGEPKFSPFIGWPCWQQIVDYVLGERGRDRK